MQTSEDYRASHLQRGSSYDSFIATVPFDAYMAEWERRHLTELVRTLFAAAPPRYLDFACGTGRVTATVAPLARETVGVDISPSMLQVAQQKVSAAEFLQADLTQEDPDLGQFDLVTSFRFFGNAQDELRHGALRAITRRMAPGGLLIINSHRNPRSFSALLDRLTGGNANNMDLHYGKLRELLHEHGLRIRLARPIGTWMFRSRLLNAYTVDHPVAQVWERRFSSALWAPVAPDVVVVAERR